VSSQHPSDLDVFAWLAAATQDSGFNLRPLNLMWSEKGADHEVSVFRSLGERLADDSGR
jgi:hypothetical protein